MDKHDFRVTTTYGGTLNALTDGSNRVGYTGDLSNEQLDELHSYGVEPVRVDPSELKLSWKARFLGILSRLFGR
ncbi:MAG: hypothetical protein JNJ91_05375 [Flavobacteriales bacterium]|nr:hypothetical protein [Flavobacteriales bacterium]